LRSLALSPHGVLYLDPHSGVDVAANVAARIEQAFVNGPGDGVLHLGAVEVDTPLPTVVGYFRDLGRDLVAALRAEPELEALRERVDLTPSAARLSELARAVPPMRGAEYVTPEILGNLWRDALESFRRVVAKHHGTVASFLHAKNPVWNLVGRVFFHLAENKGDEEKPFAFLATYTQRVSAQAKPQHRPLGKAVEESAGAKDKKTLLALLVPVERASERSTLVRAMVESGEIYHPLAWTPDEAYAFLREAPLLEDAGIFVRVPNWWNARHPPRPEARMTVGTKEPAGLGVGALIDFNVDVVLDGERLTRAELREILNGANGLRLVKGRWVEVDRDKLAAVLDHWKFADEEARSGLSFYEAMRLLAGAKVGGSVEEMRDRGAGWSRVEAGPWLASVLDGLRSPEGLAALEPGAALHAELRPYQKVGLKWLFWLSSIGLGGCLADDMGLGKTIQVLALLLVLKKRKKETLPSLLVVPASLVGNWTAEVARFAPTLDMVVVHPSAMKAAELAGGAASRIDRADVALTTYGTLQRAAWLRERVWDVVVLDEAQAIKNPGAKQTRAVKQVRARTRLALTGTPVENHLGDLWSLFDYMMPGLLGTAQEFGKVAKDLARRDEGGAYAPLRDLVRPYILRRLKSDKRIIADLPDKTELRTFCPLKKRQAALYQDAVASLADKLERASGMERRGAVLAALLGLKQICNHPSQWLGDGVWNKDESGKLARLRELCEPLAERQEKVLVFTQFREMTDPLAGFLEEVFGRPGLVLHGGTKVSDRKKLVDAFQAELGPPFFVLSIKAGGTGLNLTAASHVIHFDRWWNPAVEDQATDRAYRIGQKRSVLVHKFVCRGTVEERIDALIESKKSLSSEILDGGGEVVLTELSNEALMRMVSLDMASALEE
jgi:non-specific serine/threonine protein kinase